MTAAFRAAALGLALAAFTLAPARAEFSEAEKAEIGTVIRDYLLANPEVLEEAIEVLQQRRAEDAVAATRQRIEENGDRIFESEHQMVLGNPEGAVTVVEFFDYNCGYCKRAVADIVALIEANPDVRVVMKEFPILSEGSAEAAGISVAVKDIAPDRYLEFHQELFARPGPADSAKALEVAKYLGLDTGALTAAAQKPSITENIQEVHDLAGLLGISGTPSYVIGTELVPGAVGYDKLQATVASVREAAAGARPTATP